jgi:hypothetical protein
MRTHVSLRTVAATVPKGESTAPDNASRLVAISTGVGCAGDMAVVVALATSVACSCANVVNAASRCLTKKSCRVSSNFYATGRMYSHAI